MISVARHVTAVPRRDTKPPSGTFTPQKDAKNHAETAVHQKDWKSGVFGTLKTQNGSSLVNVNATTTGDTLMPALKTDADRLLDANEIIRKKNLELLDNKRTIAQLRKEEDTAQAIRQEIFGLAAHTCTPPDWLTGKGTKNGARGGPVTIWSDWHYGEVVNPDEIGGVNIFNQNVAKRRIRKLTDITIDLCTNHMGRAGVAYPGMVVCLGGDMIGGDIHEELIATNDRTPHQSVHDLVDLIGAGLEAMASKFGRVFVPCVVGNHGRSTRKPSFKRRVFTNYDWSIYCTLERDFRKDKRIQIMVPNEADAHFSVFGHRFLLTHGDSLGVKGGDGIIGAMGPIMRGLVKLHNSKAQVGMDFDTALICHWHQYFSLPGLVVNGALKGYDEFSYLALRAKYQRPTQALLFAHPEHGITAQWPVYLEPKQAAAHEKVWVEWAK
jgi:hypothetical protein